MPSPFPGMNPYLEHPHVWQDFHESFIPACRDAITANLSSDFVVKIEQDATESCYLEIKDRNSWQTIARIELCDEASSPLSPKQNLNFHAVTINLRRGAQRAFKDLPACDYYVLVSRVEQRPRAAVWPIQLREPLPVVPMPLRAVDQVCPLDLQQVLHRVFDSAGYARWIYALDPIPTLRPEDAVWARTLCRKENV